MVNERVKHLWWRAGFGVPLDTRDFHSEKDLLGFLFNESKVSSPLLEPVSEGRPGDVLKMSPQERVEAVRKRADVIRNLNYQWYLRMASGKGVLREKMTLFWTNHFSCRSGSAAFTQQLHEVIRENAMGSFRVLLTEVSKSPAMLQFLNNQQNRKAHPNENFAREVMELFTLGRGNYSEQDIKEAARAFTGWSFDSEGRFVFRTRVHDDGEKAILGERGRFTGEDVIRILLKQVRTAEFITEKFWRSFVSDHPDKEIIKKLAADFYSSDYDISLLIRSVFGAEWFYSSRFRGELIKSPTELMIPLIRDFSISFANMNVLLGFQKVMGQILFNPPNVAGWPGGRNWIDSSSLAVRMRIATVMLKNEMPEFDSKEDADANNPFREKFFKGDVKSTSDWKDFMEKWASVEEEKLLPLIADRMLAVPLSENTLQLAKKYTYGETKAERIRSIVLFITTLPEYQLC